MSARESTQKHPIGRLATNRCSSSRLVPLLLGVALSSVTPALLEASPEENRKSAAAAADSLPGTVSLESANAPAAQPSIWERVRSEAQRIREPDTRLLRYTVRYAISNELAEKITRIAIEEGIDPDLAFRLVHVESRFQPRARSRAGALGLTQLMPGTARVLDRSLRTEADILHPETNLALGFRYLRTMIERYNGDVRLALLAYNRGPGAVDRALRQGRNPENGYSRKVLGTGSGRYRGEGLSP